MSNLAICVALKGIKSIVYVLEQRKGNYHCTNALYAKRKSEDLNMLPLHTSNVPVRIAGVQQKTSPTIFQEKLRKLKGVDKETHLRTPLAFA